MLGIKGSILTEAERPEEALQAFDEALRLDPEDKSPLMYKAQALSDLHRYNESIETYQKVIELSANESSNWITNALIGKGDALNATGRKDEALEAYRSLLKIKEQEIQENPEDSMAWKSKGRALFKMGQYEEAIEAFDRSIEVSPGPYAIFSASDACLGGKGRCAAQAGQI